MWLVPDGLPNSGGTLALHIAGNLRHFVGTVLGGDSYVRDRDAEFAKRGVPRAELIGELRQRGEGGSRRRAAPRSGEVQRTVPICRWRTDGSNTGDFMLHLATHLAYHVGQVDFHRRIVTGTRQGLARSHLRNLQAPAR